MLAKLLISIFIPSWRFFDQIGSFVTLEVRSQNSSWKKALNLEPFKFQQLIFNPKNNLNLYYNSLLGRFVSENYPDDILELIKKISREQLPTNEQIKFRILVTTPKENIFSEQAYESEWF